MYSINSIYIPALLLYSVCFLSATEFTKTLTQMELVQSEIGSNVQNNKTLLQGVQESFATNLNEMNQKVINLDSRIKTLQPKK